MLKKSLLLNLFLLFGNVITAQVAIGKSSVNGDALLDFPDNTTNGIILPAVTTLPTGLGATNGTMLLDYTAKRIKMRENNQWVDMSPETGNITSITINSSTDSGKGVVIGNQSTTVEGVLVLDSTQKALVLPKIDRPHLNVVNPYPGMICYDTYNKVIAVYNGSYWYFWK